MRAWNNSTMTKRAFLAIACWGILIGWSTPERSRAAESPASPTFACTSPAEIEAVICQDGALSAADRQMAVLYQLAKPGPLNLGSSQLAAQRQWLKQRNGGCASGAWRKTASRSLRACIADAYRERLTALAVADLFAAPQLALAELRETDPKSAPYYEAVLDYATIADPARRTLVVGAKLAPFYATLSPRLQDGLKYAGAKATTARDAASSDQGFTQFFDISSMMDDIDLVWPCAALIKRPGLVAGLGSLWGGAIDNAVPASDCENALPAPAGLAMLGRAAFDAQPPCNVSIRFTTGRDYAMLEDAVRLHRQDIWRSQAPETSTESAAFRRKQSVVLGHMASALAAYYAQYWNVPKAAALADGRAAVDALVSAAFEYCD
jgi:uncharacterized protein